LALNTLVCPRLADLVRSAHAVLSFIIRTSILYVERKIRSHTHKIVAPQQYRRICAFLIQVIAPLLDTIANQILLEPLFYFE